MKQNSNDVGKALICRCNSVPLHGFGMFLINKKCLESKGLRYFICLAQNLCYLHCYSEITKHFKR